MTQQVQPQPYTIHFPEDALIDVRNRVAAFPWHEMPADGGWGYGTNLDYMKDLCGYWLDGFDWRPLSNEWDYPAVLERVSQEIFSDEFDRLARA